MEYTVTATDESTDTELLDESREVGGQGDVPKKVKSRLVPASHLLQLFVWNAECAIVHHPQAEVDGDMGEQRFEREVMEQLGDKKASALFLRVESVNDETPEFRR